MLLSCDYENSSFNEKVKFQFQHIDIVITLTNLF